MAKPRLRRFPLPALHVGTDICHVPRVYAILAQPAAVRQRVPTSSPVSPAAAASSPAARLVHRILVPTELPPVASPLPADGPTSQAPAQVLAWLAAGGQASVLLDPARPPRSLQAPTPTSTSTPGTVPRHALLWRAAQYLAGRFAAKEAAIKAHPHLGLTLHQVRIQRTRDDARNGSGPPVALVQVATAHETQELEQEARISISHDGDYATAVCLGFTADDHND